MAAFLSDTIGDIDDSVRLVLAGEEVLIAESWDVQESVLSAPAAWTIDMGWGRTASSLLQRYPPRTPFELYVGNAKQFTGRTGSRGANQPPGSATTLQFRGRDALGPLASSDVTAELSIADPTYARIVWHALQQVGLAPSNVSEPDPAILETSNAANRSVKAGVKVIETLPVITATEFLAGQLGIGSDQAQVRCKVGETWHAFCRRYLDPAGLFLWAAADGTFVLSAPNANQKPAYEIIRRRGSSTSNVLGFHFDDDTDHRHSGYTVYSRGGGKKSGPAKVIGTAVDDEMVGYGFTYPGVIRTSIVQSAAEAAFIARRKLAEQRRSSWTLSYVVQGHTLPVYDGKGQRAVIIPDTIIHVDDEELGIQKDLYVESVRKKRSPATTTEIHLMRVEDLIFGGATD